MSPTSSHWDKIFSNTDDANLGWYEDDVSHTLKLLKLIANWEHSNMFLVGTGTSILIETVLDEGVYLTLNDISAAALDKVKIRLGKKSESINWLCQDISEPVDKESHSESSIDIWVDRAVLHFLTDEKSIKGYFDNLKAY